VRSSIVEKEVIATNGDELILMDLLPLNDETDNVLGRTYASQSFNFSVLRVTNEDSHRTSRLLWD